MEYLVYNNSYWEETDLRCGRDNELIYREVLYDGRVTDHFCCSRLGCTWTNYQENIDLLKLSVKKYNGDRDE